MAPKIRCAFASPFMGEWTALKSEIEKSFQAISTAGAADATAVAVGKTGVGARVGVEVIVGIGVKVGSSRCADPQPVIARLVADKLSITNPSVLHHCSVFIGPRAVMIDSLARGNRAAHLIHNSNPQGRHNSPPRIAFSVARFFGLVNKQNDALLHSTYWIHESMY